MEEKEYEFVHETIKKKPVNKKKLLRRTVDSRTCCGIRSGGVCYLSSDRAGHQQCAQSGKDIQGRIPGGKERGKATGAFNGGERCQAGSAKAGGSGGGSQVRSDPVCHDCIWD